MTDGIQGTGPVVECPNGCGYRTRRTPMGRHVKACWFPFTIERLAMKYPPVINADGCWTGGEGKWVRVNSDKRKIRIYVAAAMLYYGQHEIVPPLQVCHHCDNRDCYNPEHLFIGTQKDNIRDAMVKGRVRGSFYWSTEERSERMKGEPGHRARKARWDRHRLPVHRLVCAWCTIEFERSERQMKSSDLSRQYCSVDCSKHRYEVARARKI